MLSQLKILFLDDHAGLRDSLGSFLSNRNSSFNFLYAGTSEEAKYILENNPDIGIAIVDINLDGINGLDKIDSFRQIISELRIIVYSMFNDVLHIEQALQKHIQGFITKEASIEEIEKAILLVSQGYVYYNKSVQQVLPVLLNSKNTNSDKEEKSSSKIFENYKMLTKKEKEVFELLAQQMDSQEIAKILGKSEKTINNQTSIIYQKIGIHNRMELLKVAKFLGVIL